MKSMTGFGEASVSRGELTVLAEAKSVNHRFLKVQIKLEDSHESMDRLVEKCVKETLARGSVTLSIRMDRPATKLKHRINLQAVERYAHQLAPLGGSIRDMLPALLQLPGAVEESPHEFDLEDDAPTIELAVKAALAKLVEMRVLEGKSMQSELLSLGSQMAKLVKQISDRLPVAIEEYRVRLAERVGQAVAGHGVKIANSELVREVALLVERSDIAEETSRLNSHLDQFASMLRAEEPIGRKLDFLCQEMFRESNTIGSKSLDVEMARLAVELKSYVEQVRELVQNVE